MLEGINNKEYEDYIKYYGEKSPDILNLKFLPDAANENDKVVNVNLNLFLKILGASNEIIEDDYKTLQFMMYIKFSLDELKAMRLIFDTPSGACNE